MSAPVTTGLKRVVVASTTGTVVECFEFFLYGTAATIVFNKVFFSETDDADADELAAERQATVG